MTHGRNQQKLGVSNDIHTRKKWMSSLRQGKCKETKIPWTRIPFDCGSTTENPTVLLPCKLKNTSSFSL